jgi:RNA polymerase sigma factor (sigma-70 family)
MIRVAMDIDSSFDLIERAQAGDSTALNELLTRYRPRLRRWASGRLPAYARDIADTEDLVQEAMIGTFKNLKAFERRSERALQGYLRTAVSNRIKDQLRRIATQPRRDVLPDSVRAHGASPLETMLGREVFQQYEHALSTLDEVEREAVIARLELGCSYQEIADLVDKPSADAARMMVGRALAKLAKEMG